MKVEIARILKQEGYINGYSVEAELKVKTSEGVDSDKEEMVLVELEEDGWKVIPLSVEQLKQILE